MTLMINNHVQLVRVCVLEIGVDDEWYQSGLIKSSTQSNRPWFIKLMCNSWTWAEPLAQLKRAQQESEREGNSLYTMQSYRIQI